MAPTLAGKGHCARKISNRAQLTRPVTRSTHNNKLFRPDALATADRIRQLRLVESKARKRFPDLRHVIYGQYEAPLYLLLFPLCERLPNGTDAERQRKSEGELGHGADDAAGRQQAGDGTNRGGDRRRVALLGLAKRVARYYGVVRPAMALGCPEPLPDRAFLSYIWNFEKKFAPVFIKNIDLYGSDVPVAILGSHGEMASLLDMARNSKTAAEIAIAR